MQYRKRFEPPVLPMGHSRCEKVHLEPIVYSGMQCNNNKSTFERYWFAFVEVKASVLLFMMYTDLLKNLAIKEDYGLLLSVKGLIWTDDSRG